MHSPRYRTAPHGQKCWPQRGKHAWSSVLPGSSSYPGARVYHGSDRRLFSYRFVCTCWEALLGLPGHWFKQITGSKSGRGTEQTSGAETERRRCRIVFEDLACQPDGSVPYNFFCLVMELPKHLCVRQAASWPGPNRPKWLPPAQMEEGQEGWEWQRSRDLAWSYYARCV